MIQFIYLCILSIIAIISFARKKKSDLLLLLFIVYLIITMGGSTQNPDTEVYNGIYNSSTFFYKDIGFGVLVYLARQLNLSYGIFKLLLSIIGITLIHLSAKKFIRNEFFFFLLYFIYPFFFDVVQVRNFLAMSFMIYGTTFLIECKSSNIIKFLLFALLGASFQKVAIVYIPFVFFINSYKNKNINTILFVFAFISIIVGLNKNFVVKILTNLSFLLDLDGFENYLEINTNNGWIVFWCEQIIAFILVCFARKIVIQAKKRGKIEQNSKLYIFTNLIFTINLYCFIFMPLFSIDENYTRIIRNIIPLNLILFIMIFEKRKVIKNNPLKYSFDEIVYWCGTIGFEGLMFLLMASTYYEKIVKAILTINWIW